MAVTLAPIASIVEAIKINKELLLTAKAAVMEAIPVPNMIKAIEIPMELLFSFSITAFILRIGENRSILALVG